MTLIVDASVWAKLYLPENDSPTAKAFCKWLVTSQQVLLAPFILKHELCLAALSSDLDFLTPLSVLEGYQKIGLQLLDPPLST